MRRRAGMSLVSILVMTVAWATPVAAGQRVASSTDLWAARVMHTTGVKVQLLLGPDGVHHVSVPDVNNGYGGSYVTDRGNRWVVQPVSGRVDDMALDPNGHIFLVAERPGVSANDPRLILANDLAGPLASEIVPGSDHAVVSTVAIDGTGTVHVAWTDGNWNVKYATWSGGTWSSIRTVVGIDVPRATSMSMAFDGNGTPHVLSAGTLEIPSQATGSCAGSTVCGVDVAMTDPATTTPIGTFDTTSMEAITGENGSIEAIYGTDTSLVYLTNKTASWATQTVAEGNILAGTLSRGPNGLVAIYGLGDNTGIRRADLVGSTWQVSSIADDIPGPFASGVVDGDDNPHVAFTISYWQEGGYLPDAWVAAPDTVGPVITGPFAKPAVGKTVGSTLPISIYWSGTDAQSGADHYQLQQSTSGGAWSTLSSTLTTRSVVRSLTSGRFYAFRVRGVDGAGNVGPFGTGPTIRATAYQQTSSGLIWSGTWHTASSTNYWGGTGRYATSGSASVKVTTSARGFAWVSNYASNRGSVKVFVDGVWVTTINLRRSTSKYRVIVWSIGWSALATHTLMLKPSSSSRVDVDGIVVIR